MIRDPSIGENRENGTHRRIDITWEGQEINKKKYFALCECCFWCATLIKFFHTDANISRCNECPSCSNPSIAVSGLKNINKLMLETLIR